MTTCRYHCRRCASHFTSLEAFDAHRDGPMDDRRCEFPDHANLIEVQGVCRISEFDAKTAEPLTTTGTIYATARSGEAREYFSEVEARQTEPVGRTSAPKAA